MSQFVWGVALTESTGSPKLDMILKIEFVHADTFKTNSRLTQNLWRPDSQLDAAPSLETKLTLVGSC